MGQCRRGMPERQRADAQGAPWRDNGNGNRCQGGLRRRAGAVACACLATFRRVLLERVTGRRCAAFRCRAMVDMAGHRASACLFPDSRSPRLPMRHVVVCRGHRPAAPVQGQAEADGQAQQDGPEAHLVTVSVVDYPLVQPW